MLHAKDHYLVCVDTQVVSYLRKMDWLVNEQNHKKHLIEDQFFLGVIQQFLGQIGCCQCSAIACGSSRNAQA